MDLETNPPPPLPNTTKQKSESNKTEINMRNQKK